MSTRPHLIVAGVVAGLLLGQVDRLNAQPNLYVDANRSQSGDGLRWESAMTDLNAAINFVHAYNGTVPPPPVKFNTLRVAKGSYKPTTARGHSGFLS